MKEVEEKVTASEPRKKSCTSCQKNALPPEEAATKETTRKFERVPISEQKDPGEDTSSSSPKKIRRKTTEKLKRVDSKSRSEDNLDNFQNPKLAPEKWETLADELLQRGVQKTADEKKERGTISLTNHWVLG